MFSQKCQGKKVDPRLATFHFGTRFKHSCDLIFIYNFNHIIYSITRKQTMKNINVINLQRRFFNEDNKSVPQEILFLWNKNSLWCDSWRSISLRSNLALRKTLPVHMLQPVKIEISVDWETIMITWSPFCDFFFPIA